MTCTPTRCNTHELQLTYLFSFPFLLSFSCSVVASEKGIVVGRISFKDDGDPIDCTRMGVGGKAIPPSIDRITDIKGDAKFILLVEKDAAFMRLAEDRFYHVRDTRVHATPHPIHKRSGDHSIPACCLFATFVLFRNIHVASSQQRASQM